MSCLVKMKAVREDLSANEKKIGDFGAKAKDGKLSMEDLTGGTFSISNGGVFGSMHGATTCPMGVFYHQGVSFCTVRQSDSARWVPGIKPMRL